MHTNENNSKALAIITYITLIGWIIAFALNNKQKKHTSFLPPKTGFGYSTHIF